MSDSRPAITRSRILLPVSAGTSRCRTWPHQTSTWLASRAASERPWSGSSSPCRPYRQAALCAADGQRSRYPESCRTPPAGAAGARPIPALRCHSCGTVWMIPPRAASPRFQPSRRHCSPPAFGARSAMAHHGRSRYNPGMNRAAFCLGSAASSGCLPPLPLPTRRLGKTELRVPLVGYGTAPGGSGLSDRDAIELLHHRRLIGGVTYLDTAPAYERAQRQLRSVLAERRDEVIVATKVPVDGAAEALASLTGSLEVLGTDHVDIAYVHSLGGRDVDRVLAADGALAGLRQAQRAGMTRFVGFTSHNRPQAVGTRLLRECEVDVIMVALNYGDQTHLWLRAPGAAGSAPPRRGGSGDEGLRRRQPGCSTPPRRRRPSPPWVRSITSARCAGRWIRRASQSR